MAEADLVLVLDSGVPWIERATPPAPGARVVHVGPDPLFATRPVRGFRSDLVIAADPADRPVPGEVTILDGEGPKSVRDSAALRVAASGATPYQPIITVSVNCDSGTGTRPCRDRLIPELQGVRTRRQLDSGPGREVDEHHRGDVGDRELVAAESPRHVR